MDHIRASDAVNLPLVRAIVGVATIGGFMFGYDSGVINGTQEGLRSTFGLSDGWLGVTVSALLPGCAVGAFVAGRAADVWGRRQVMRAAAVLFMLSAVAAGAAATAAMMILARFCRRCGCGRRQCPLACVYQRSDASVGARPAV